eukprot:13963483-Ditylum_brightwellii.AAC.1
MGSESKEEDDYNDMQPSDYDDRTIIIQELAHRMDVTEEKLEKKKEAGANEKESEQMDLMNTVLERM